MSRDETALELEKLRADVAALKEARKATEQKPEPQGASTEPTGRADQAESAEAITKKEQSQLEELSALLEAEIRDHPTVTTLAVFTLGILIGRMLR